MNLWYSSNLDYCKYCAPNWQSLPAPYSCKAVLYIYISAFIAKKHRNLPRKGIQHTPLSYLETNTCHIFFKIFFNKQNYKTMLAHSVHSLHRTPGPFPAFPWHEKPRRVQACGLFPSGRGTALQWHLAPGLGCVYHYGHGKGRTSSHCWVGKTDSTWGGQPNKSNQKNDIEVGITMV